MKLTKSRLKKLIQEELDEVFALEEQPDVSPTGTAPPSAPTSAVPSTSPPGADGGVKNTRTDVRNLVQKLLKLQGVRRLFQRINTRQEMEEMMNLLLPLTKVRASDATTALRHSIGKVKKSG